MVRVPETTGEAGDEGKGPANAGCSGVAGFALAAWLELLERRFLLRRELAACNSAYSNGGKSSSATSETC